MNVLVTNDDGVNSEGLRALASALREVGDVYIVAPDRERNATSHALTLHKPLRVEEIAEKIYAVSGTPTDCVYLGVKRLIVPPPVLVASGINKGGNLGDDVTYSGTVSAAMEGALLNIPSFAVSLVGEGNFYFETAAHFAGALARAILSRGRSRMFLNVNVPNIPIGAVKGVKVTFLGRRFYRGNEVVEQVDPRGKKYYWIGGDHAVWEEKEGVDSEAVQAGIVSITPLRLDMTDYPAMEFIREWEQLLWRKGARR